MKFTKRMLCALLLVIFTLVNTIAMPAFADFTDVKEDAKIYTAVSVLSKLKVINGYEDGSFKPENNVTRAEFTAMLLRTRGLGTLGSTDLENPPFPDVSTSDVSWAIGNIRTAREMGIINGYEDGTFRPNNNVSYEEAVKMIVCALGYENFGTAGSEWYSKYIMTANSLGFLGNSGGEIGTPATRGTIAQMLYNCLEVDLAEDNEVTKKTILENDLKLTKKTGFIASNAETSLSAPDTNLKADEIQINAPSDTGKAYSTLTYKVDNASEYKDMLGAQITFYYQEDRATDTRTVILATVKNSEIITVNAKDIEGSECSTSELAYYKDDNASNTTKLKISDDSIVVFNGKLYGNNEANSSFADYYNTEKDPIPTIGSVKLLDRDGDRNFDIIFIEKYEAFYASSVTSSNYTVTDNLLGEKGRKAVLNPDTPDYNVTFVDDSGKEATFSSIKTGSVVCVKSSNPSNGGTVEKVAVITNKTVSGTIKGVTTGKSVKIDGKDYKYSEQAPWVLKTYTGSDALTEPAMSESGKYYLDMDGNIIAYTKDAKTANQQYGYIMKASLKSNSISDDQLVLNILTQTGSKTKYSAYSKTKVNGATFDTYDELLAELEKTARPDDKNDFEANIGNYKDAEITNRDSRSQLIKFSTTTNKGETVLDEIVTVTSDTSIPETKGVSITSDKLNYYAAMPSGEAATYSTTGKQFTLNGKTAYAGSSIVFNIPLDRGETNEYKKSTITTSSLANGKKYNVEFYDVSSTGSASVVLLYYYPERKSSNEVTAESPVIVITSIEGENNEKDGRLYKIEGFNGSTAVTGFCSPESSAWDTVQVGDVVRVGTDDDNYYTLEKENIVFGVGSKRDSLRDEIAAKDDDSDSSTYIVTDDISSYKGNFLKADYAACWGSAYDMDEADESNPNAGVILISPQLDVTDESNIIRIERSRFANAKMYRFDATAKNADGIITEIDKAENISTLNSLDTFVNGGQGSEVFVFMSNETVKMMIVVDR